MGATIRIGREMLCLLYAGFLTIPCEIQCECEIQSHQNSSIFQHYLVNFTSNGYVSIDYWILLQRKETILPTKKNPFHIQPFI